MNYLLIYFVNFASSMSLKNHVVNVDVASSIACCVPNFSNAKRPNILADLVL